LKRRGGLEYAGGLFSNYKMPEDAAAELRNVPDGQCFGFPATRKKEVLNERKIRLSRLARPRTLGLLAVCFVSTILINVNVYFLAGMTIPGFALAFLHGSRRYGWKGILLFLGISLVVSFTIENLAILGGFPFGQYYYTGGFPGPRIFLVPAIIGVTYFSSGYVAWELGNILLNYPDSDPKNPRFVFLQPVVASFIMVMWDLCMDPINATIAGNWVWKQGGGYFGVPLTNFLGWFVTVWIFYQLFALVVRGGKVNVRPRSERSFWYQPVVYYLILGLTDVFFYIFQAKRDVTDGSGQVWHSGGILEAMVTVFLFSMLFVVVLAFAKLAGKKLHRISEAL
jgi:putative membrane protein